MEIKMAVKPKLADRVIVKAVSPNIFCDCLNFSRPKLTKIVLKIVSGSVAIPVIKLAKTATKDT